MWPEFVRKITLLLLYDRLNSQNFRPRYWKPGNWFAQGEKEGEREQHEAGSSTFRANGSRMSSGKPQKQNLFMNDASDKDKQQPDDKNKLLEINALMANNMDLDR